jgi:predicted transcriptional regulator
MAEILSHYTQQKAKTAIMYKVNLNFMQLKKHLKVVTSQGLLVTDKNKYAATQKELPFSGIIYSIEGYARF